MTMRTVLVSGACAVLLLACPPMQGSPPDADTDGGTQSVNAGSDAGADGGSGAADSGTDAGALDAGRSDPHACGWEVPVDGGRLCVSVTDLSTPLASLVASPSFTIMGGHAGSSAWVATPTPTPGFDRYFAVLFEPDGGISITNAPVGAPSVRDTDETGALCGAGINQMAAQPALFLPDGSVETAPTVGNCFATSGDYWAGGNSGEVFVARKGASPTFIPGEDGGRTNRDFLVGITSGGIVVLNTTVSRSGWPIPCVKALEAFDGGAAPAILPDLGSFRGSFADVVGQTGVIAGTAYRFDGVQVPVVWDDAGISQLAIPADFTWAVVSSVSDDGAICGLIETQTSRGHATLWLSGSHELVDARKLMLGFPALACLGALPGGRFIIAELEVAPDGGFVSKWWLLRVTRL